ncbi:MAG: dephospho-CoA kinase [Sphingobacteriaceae bacterium]
MLKIGLTGGIGSGKTTVSHLFEVLKVPVFYADDEGKKVMVNDNLLKEAIQENFGADAYFTDGTLNRKYIAEIVFNNEIRLNHLNSLVHPAVFRAFNEWANSFKNVPYLLKETALLFESGSYKMCDYTILVTAPLEIRIARVMQRDRVSREQVEKRSDKQLTEAQKRPLADFVIRNGESDLLIPQVMALHQRFIAAV